MCPNVKLIQHHRQKLVINSPVVIPLFFLSSVGNADLVRTSQELYTHGASYTDGTRVTRVGYIEVMWKMYVFIAFTFLLCIKLVFSS